MDDPETNSLLTTVDVACKIVDNMPSSAKEYFIRKVVTNEREVLTSGKNIAMFEEGAMERVQHLVLKIAEELAEEIEIEENQSTEKGIGLGKTTGERVQEGFEPGE